MNKLNRINGQFRLSTRTLVLLSVAAAMAAGCATNPRAIADDPPDDWASRMNSLPVEVHGAAPGEAPTQAVAAINEGTAKRADAEFGRSGLSLYAMPRVVVYIGGTAVPARDQFCSLEPSRSRSVGAPQNAVILRGELCDGPRAVSYARVTLDGSNPTAKRVAGGIQQIKSELVEGLRPLDPMLQPNYWN